MSATPETGKPVADTDATTRLEDMFQVLLFNDDVNSMEHVIAAIVTLTPLNVAEAEKCMLEAHEKGISLLLVTHRERAELYVEQFASVGLTVTCEPGS